MELDVNARGNLHVRPSRGLAWLASAIVTGFLYNLLPAFHGAAGSAAGSVSLPELAGLLAAMPAWVYLILCLQSDIEFDGSRSLVVKGRTVIARYDQIRHVELRRAHNDDEARYSIALRLGAARVFQVLHTNDETSASLDAAAIARAVGKPVQLIR